MARDERADERRNGEKRSDTHDTGILGYSSGSMRPRILFGLHVIALVAACSSSATEPGATAVDATGTDSGAAAPVAAPDGGPTCPRASTPASAGTVTATAVDEASGIVASRVNPGVYWVHNDSGDTARAFALSATGTLLATLAFDTAPAIDIEDMAISEEADGASYLYFADIGDNPVNRRDYVIHRVREPKLDGTAHLTAQSEKMTVHYPDGSHNAETLWFDPLTRELFIATKVTFGNSAIHRVGPFQAGATVTTSRVAGAPVALATGGEISRDGTRLVLRNYGTSAWLWLRAPGEDVATALGHTPCKLPLATETQGEAFAFLPDGGGYVTIGEGTGQSLNLAHFQ